MSRDLAFENKLVYVMGGGKFGTNALRYFKAKGAKVLVADLDPNCMAKSELNFEATSLDVADSLKDGQAALLVGDAIEYLVDLLETKVPDLVVTAIPSNALAKVVAKWLSKREYNLEPYQSVIPRILENIPKRLVSFVDKKSSMIVVSYMPSHMSCRENCMPPKDFCASTSMPKLTSMDKLLGFSVYGLTDTSGILRSKQLTGGVGAVDGSQLFSILKRLETLHKPFTLAVGTACDCHGVLNLFKVKKATGS